MLRLEMKARLTILYIILSKQSSRLTRSYYTDLIDRIKRNSRFVELTAVFEYLLTYRHHNENDLNAYLITVATREFITTVIRV